MVTVQIDQVSPVAPFAIRFEHLRDGFGLGTAEPAISWQIPGAPADWRQEYADVEVSRGDGECRAARVDGLDQVLVRWPFEPLRSRERGTVRVRVGGRGLVSDWSDPVPFEATLLDAEDWVAQLIEPVGIGRLGEPAPVLRRRFRLDEPAATSGHARLYITAHGVYSARINGRAVGDHVLAPGWTAYRERLRFQTFDVNELLVPGDNEIEILLGNGWYRGHMSIDSTEGHYGPDLGAIAQMEVTDAAGCRRVIATDTDWVAADSAIMENDWYDGQTTDLRARPGRTGGVRIGSAVTGQLVAPDGPPVRRTELVPAVSCRALGDGRTIVDFGQNLVGWVRVRCTGAAPGDRVVVRHAEALQNGELAVEALRSAKATDTYLLAGPDEVLLEPEFTYHGFRYAEITGIDVVATDLTAVVIGTDLRRTGFFECSDPMVQQLHENTVWSMRGNFVDVPTDCPQRDERLGWTGDLQVFAPTAAFLFDCAGTLSSWLTDLRVEQTDDGCVPVVVPDVLAASAAAPVCGWGDAATVVPMTLFERYGDLVTLRRSYPSMRSWVDAVTAASDSKGLWTGGFQFGDWLDPTAPPEDALRAKADPDIVATAYRYRSISLLVQAAKALGLADEADHYGRLAQEVALAFRAEYLTPGGRIVSDAPTVYAMALEWGLIDSDSQRRAAAQRLADLVRINGFCIATGFLGTPLLCDALTNNGFAHLAYQLLLQTECPSWLFPITMGATTIWERWDSMASDGTINTPIMTSFNHYALGAVADWLHRQVAGLAPGEPGYRRLTVAPQVGGGLRHASAGLDTPYGTARTAWSLRDDTFELTVTVPVGVHAQIWLPNQDEPEVRGHGTHHWSLRMDPVRTTAPQQVRDLLDDPVLFAALLTLLKEHNAVPSASALGARLAPFLSRPPAAILDAFVPVPLAPDDQLAPELRRFIEHAGTTHRRNSK
ncbi:alpha-L-rhamnosidase [Nakamurella lactea]|uniref:alpha-L-rhamnosidase n=1 Tax=Nakamurella lactea TaxID=459515 RepID=UPI00041EFC7D|nr:alpha-L-rhamnosidase [Nakamurella lactea]